MARLPTSGATSVTPHRTESELGKVLKELCPEVESAGPDAELPFFGTDVEPITARAV